MAVPREEVLDYRAGPHGTTPTVFRSRVNSSSGIVFYSSKYVRTYVSTYAYMNANSRKMT